MSTWLWVTFQEHMGQDMDTSFGQFISVPVCVLK